MFKLQNRIECGFRLQQQQQGITANVNSCENETIGILFNSEMLLVVLVIWTNLKLKQQRYPAQETCEIGENSTTRCVECKFDICLYHIMLLDARLTNAFRETCSMERSRE